LEGVAAIVRSVVYLAGKDCWLWETFFGLLVVLLDVVLVQKFVEIVELVKRIAFGVAFEGFEQSSGVFAVYQLLKSC